jgi:CDP-diacylglycerol pyrophosphatase
MAAIDRSVNQGDKHSLDQAAGYVSGLLDEALGQKGSLASTLARPDAKPQETVTRYADGTTLIAEPNGSATWSNKGGTDVTQMIVDSNGVTINRILPNVTITDYANGTVQSYDDRDGSASWITENTAEGLRTTTSLKFHDGKGVILKTSVDGDGDVYVRNGNPNVIGPMADSCSDGQSNQCAVADKDLAVLKTNKPQYPDEFITMPTGGPDMSGQSGITGVEDPRLQSPLSPNYFALAWRDGVPQTEAAMKKLGVPIPDEFSGSFVVALNSADGRSQDRAHWHTSFTDPELQASLLQQVDSIGTSWKPDAITANGHPYDATWVPASADNAPTQDPVKLLYQRLVTEAPQGDETAREAWAQQHMCQYGIAMVGVTKSDGTKGFVILTTKVDQDPANRNWGFAEEWEAGWSKDKAGNYTIRTGGHSPSDK